MAADGCVVNACRFSATFAAMTLAQIDITVKAAQAVRYTIDYCLFSTYKFYERSLQHPGTSLVVFFCFLKQNLKLS